MENNKLLYLAVIVVIILIALTVAAAVFFYFQNPRVPPTGPPDLGPQDVNVKANVAGYLPATPEPPAEGELSAEEKLKLEKEKQFISAYWRPVAVSFAPQVPSSKLPLEKIKEEVNNYRDFSRKINLDPALAKLALNGFAVISDPFAQKAADWESGYKLLKSNDYPIFVTSDSIAGLYQNTLDIIYKETEQDIFYPSLWQLLKEMAEQAQRRFEGRYQKFGIENDLMAEASRLEFSYLAVALKLLMPESGQIRESLSPNPKYFSPLEALNYTFTIPASISQEVSAELQLIKNKTAAAKSPLWLYQKSYSQYNIPAFYLTSEKLKNYYLAITWLNDILFPLWPKSETCPDCLLEEQDHTINFLAGLYLASDLGSNQSRKNNWANIYKSISFFKGLEANLTYLDYQQALKKNLGENYDLDKEFDTDFETARKIIAKIRKTLAAGVFLTALSNAAEGREIRGLKLLRDRFLLENKFFPAISGQAAGNYSGSVTSAKDLPFSACQDKNQILRCWPSGLDLLRLLGNDQAGAILVRDNDGRYQNYEKNFDDFAGEVKKFNDLTWHDNAYLSLLDAVKYLANKASAGWPTFMQNDGWEKKTLNTALAAWADYHREINLEKAQTGSAAGFIQYFPYGYLEPQPEFYARLLTNVKMVADGFKALQIISDQSAQAERLKKLETLLQTAVDISQKELKNEELSSAQYDFINNFGRQIQRLYGDIKKENLQLRYTYAYPSDKNTLNEFLDGFNYLIVIYPNPEKKLFFAIGPVYNYSEGKNGQKILADWQKTFRP